MRSRKLKWAFRLLPLVLVALAGVGAYSLDRMALSYLTGQRRVPGRDFSGAPIRMDGPVPGFAFLGQMAPSEQPPGVRVVRPREAGREIGLRPGDAITEVDGKTFHGGDELHRYLLSDHTAGDRVTLTVEREGEAARALLLVLDPFLRSPADLGLPYMDVEIRSTSGFTLRGWFIPPPEGSDGRSGVFVHGAKSSRFQGLAAATHWYRRGYGFLMMDLSGRGASDGDYVTYTVNERLDVASMTKWLRERPTVKADAVVVFGTSNGAASSIFAAAEDPAIAALALDAPFSDLWAASGEMLESRGASPLLRYPLSLFVRARAGLDLAVVRPIDVITQIRAPVLFIHGDADDEVPPYHSERMAEARKQAGLPTERWLLPGGQHGFDNYPPEGIFWNRVLDFIDAALGGAPPALTL
ncbi:MAG TPA: CocE/NonD family hydrolase [Vicinamibacteria bacterium]|jgi:dipeptidyl aminopeptidase/acylaminoacyl peptidase